MRIDKKSLDIKKLKILLDLIFKLHVFLIVNVVLP